MTENEDFPGRQVVKLYISVIGASEATSREFDLSVEVGKEIARAGCVLVCGGLSGVMEGAAKGASENGGKSIGILPQDNRRHANPYLSFSLPTGLGHMRNYLVVAGGDGVLAIGGGAGTLSEMGMAMKLQRPVVLLESLDLKAVFQEDPKVRCAKTPGEAVTYLLRELR